MHAWSNIWNANYLGGNVWGAFFTRKRETSNYLFCMLKTNQLWSNCGTKNFWTTKQYFHIDINCAGWASTTIKMSGLLEHRNFRPMLEQEERTNLKISREKWEHWDQKKSCQCTGWHQGCTREQKTSVTKKKLRWRQTQRKSNQALSRYSQLFIVCKKSNQLCHFYFVCFDIFASEIKFFVLIDFLFLFFFVVVFVSFFF